MALADSPAVGVEVQTLKHDPPLLNPHEPDNDEPRRNPEI